jgi:hypothetical protein
MTQIKDLNAVNHNKIAFSRLNFLWLKNVVYNFELRTEFAHFRKTGKLCEELFGAVRNAELRDWIFHIDETSHFKKKKIVGI